jgi:eukaryotic-like serine/threonine-protein kinase
MRYCQACHHCYGDVVEFCLFDHTPTRTADAIPLLIDGKYRLEQLIAHGGMGAVYRATHVPLERPVAIKILRAELLADNIVRERFHREARAAARLKHPNLVAVYDFGLLANGGAYLVMELIEGRSLREEMRTHAARHGQMRPERAAFLLAQVCQGIEAAHRLGIIHRDLKPDNVMIETPAYPDAAERVLVLDFGIAKLKDREGLLQGLTDEDVIIGTPNYISPEQCTGQPVDARSDVYALGVILYEMLTGRVPFTGENTSAVLLKHLQEPPTPPTRFRAELDRGLESVILRALAKNPQQRFGSATQFAESLLAAVKTLRPVDETVTGEAETIRRAFVVPPLAGTEAAPDQVINSVTKEAVSAPRLMMEQRSRAKFYASVCIVTLAMIGTLSYFWYAKWRTLHVRASTPTTANASASATLVQTPTPVASIAVKQKMPIALVAIETPQINPLLAERAQREVQALYAEWTAAAQRGDWPKHMSFYAERVDYFRDGTLARAKVEARKRSIFKQLDGYELRFSERPQITVKNLNGQPETEVAFDRQWILRRGRKQVAGRARGLVTLRREARGWRIISERQLKK